MNITYLIQSGPYDKATAMELIDAALSAATFEHKVQLIFRGEGIQNLLPLQASAINSRDYTAVLAGLDWYDIPVCWAEHESMHALKLTARNLISPIHIKTRAEISSYLRTAPFVIDG